YRRLLLRDGGLRSIGIDVVECLRRKHERRSVLTLVTAHGGRIGRERRSIATISSSAVFAIASITALSCHFDAAYRDTVDGSASCQEGLVVCHSTLLTTCQNSEVVVLQDC